jgi:hypothetical protein
MRHHFDDCGDRRRLQPMECEQVRSRRPADRQHSGTNADRPRDQHQRSSEADDRPDQSATPRPQLAHLRRHQRFRRLLVAKARRVDDQHGGVFRGYLRQQPGQPGKLRNRTLAVGAAREMLLELTPLGR